MPRSRVPSATYTAGRREDYSPEDWAETASKSAVKVVWVFVGSGVDVELELGGEVGVEALGVEEEAEFAGEFFEWGHHAVRITSWMASIRRSNSLDSRVSCLRPSGVSL